MFPKITNGSSVKVKAEGHEREGQAGTVLGDSIDGVAQVRFDLDGQIVEVQVTDVQVL